VSFLTSMVVGGLIGWLARMLVTDRSGMNMLLSVLAGAAGALLSGWLISPLVGLVPSAQDSFSLLAVMVAVIGAVVMLGLADMARRMVSR
jgi:uncharacterized membrane protein YeaQ/YmgE (transglycosylase-associated protein family)